jgi:hypothetical protein
MGGKLYYAASHGHDGAPVVLLIVLTREIPRCSVFRVILLYYVRECHPRLIVALD